MTALDAHEVTATRNCRISSCANEVRAGAPARGPWANLCDEHHAIEVAKKRAERGSSAAPKPRANGSAPSEVSFEKRAKGLVAAGRQLDRAKARSDQAKARAHEANTDLASALREWRDLCRKLAGDSLDE